MAAAMGQPVSAHQHVDYKATKARMVQPEAAAEIGPWGIAFTADIDHVLVSWDVVPGAGAGARLQVATVRGEERSPWLTLARTGDPEALASLPDEIHRTDLDRVLVDVLACGEPAEAVAVRVVAVGGPVEIRGVWATFTDEADNPPQPGNDAIASLLDPVPEAFELHVPHHAQAEAGDELASRLCSPTSLTMTLGYHGISHPVAVVAGLAYDPSAGIYGNWVNNTLAACRFGVPTVATRLGSWAELETALQHGPVVLSVPGFTPETLGGTDYTSTSGHLFVARGFDERGDVIVTDPAHRERTKAETVYSRADLTRLWLLDNLGTCYLPAAALQDLSRSRDASDASVR